MPAIFVISEKAAVSLGQNAHSRAMPTSGAATLFPRLEKCRSGMSLQQAEAAWNFAQRLKWIDENPWTEAVIGNQTTACFPGVSMPPWGRPCGNSRRSVKSRPAQRPHFASCSSILPERPRRRSPIVPLSQEPGGITTPSRLFPLPARESGREAQPSHHRRLRDTLARSPPARARTSLAFSWSPTGRTVAGSDEAQPMVSRSRGFAHHKNCKSVLL